MKGIRRSISLVCLTLAIGTGDCLAASGTPTEQYKALLKEYNSISGAQREAKTDLERKEAVDRMAEFPVRFVELAEKHPKDPVVLAVLRQAVQVVGSTDSAAQNAWEASSSIFPDGITDDVTERIIALLQRDHLLSPDLAPVIDRMRYGYRMKFGEFLSDALKSNPHRDIQGVACLALAQFLNDKLRLLQLSEDRPDLNRRNAIALGKDHLPGLRRIGQAELKRRIESLFERAAKDYSDVKHAFRGTVGEWARSELDEIRRLSVGKPAPEMAGKDQDGADFKLSDYRGRVVLLYFWMEH